ncbi:MAG: hypothetical protein IPJ65_42620 [Archangiaceae bacterium]|nr:hypothetical protein [Archangiaceae bacterium]
MPMRTTLQGPVQPFNPKTTDAASAPATVAQAPRAAPAQRVDSGHFDGGVTAAGLNPLVPAGLQKATLERALTLAETLAQQGKVPLFVIDHRLTGLDDRPLIADGLQTLARRRGVSELFDVSAALSRGELKFLPGYTEQASDAWRHAHPKLMQKYPGAFGAEGTRIDIGFMEHPVRMANATAGLAELDAALKLRTGGRGRLVFAGSGTGTTADLLSVYTRSKAEGGAGLDAPDVRFGAPNPSPEADQRAQALAEAFEREHPGEVVPLDRDSRGKAGWVEVLESERGPNGEEQVVVAFADDRLHNRIAVQAAGRLGTNLIAIRAAAPGISVSESDANNPNQVSTFSLNPG